MGINLKDIMEPKHDELVMDKQKQTMKRLIFAAVVVFILIVIVLIVNTIINVANNEVAQRARLLAPDMINLSAKVVELGEQNRVDPEGTELVGRNLEIISNDTRVESGPITIGGEEYRYGYYYLTAEEVNSIMISLNLKTEDYIVNYTTGDVVNCTGLKKGRKIYYTLADIGAIYENETPASEYTINIASAADMEKLRTYPNAYFKLSANIDMSTYSGGDGWNPVEKFSGSIEGRGYKISNLTISRTNQTYCGLFGQVTSDATISNIVIENAKIKGGEYTGTIAGYCSGTIKNCRVLGSTIDGSSRSTGSIVGAYAQGNMTNTYANSNKVITGSGTNDYVINATTVTGTEATGGLIGTLFSGTVSQCYFIGNVVGMESAGGLIGRIQPNDTTLVNQCYSDTQLSGKNAVGGLVGEINIISSNSLKLLNLYALGAIQNGETRLGGVVGNVSTMTGSGIDFDSVYTAVDIIPNSDSRGGFVGQNNNATGTSVSVFECFWEKDPLLDLTLKDIGVLQGSSSITFTSKTPVEMKTKVTFARWNIEVWKIDDSTRTPYFRWQAQQ